MEVLLTTEKLEKRLNLTKNLGILILVIGLVLLMFKDFSEYQFPRSAGAFIDSFVTIVLGTYFYFSSSSQLKNVSGSFVEFLENRLRFRSRNNEKELKLPEDIKNVDVKTKTVEITDSSNEEHTIYLDDYTDYSDKKMLKEKFEELKRM